MLCVQTRVHINPDEHVGDATQIPSAGFMLLYRLTVCGNNVSRNAESCHEGRKQEARYFANMDKKMQVSK